MAAAPPARKSAVRARLAAHGRPPAPPSPLHPPPLPGPLQARSVWPPRRPSLHPRQGGGGLVGVSLRGGRARPSCIFSGGGRSVVCPTRDNTCRDAWQRLWSGRAHARSLSLHSPARKRIPTPRRGGVCRPPPPAPIVSRTRGPVKAARALTEPRDRENGRASGGGEAVENRLSHCVRRAAWKTSG